MAGCCGMLSGRLGLFLTGGWSLLGCCGVLLPSLYCLVREGAWASAREWVNSWLVRNHWDVGVTQSVWRSLDWAEQHHQLLLAVLVSSASLHLLNTLLLLLAAMVSKRSLLIPWILTDLIIIILMVIIFISWTFLSFFVDLLIAIFFPVLAGLLIGVWVVLWRNTLDMYSTNMNPTNWRRDQKSAPPNLKTGYKAVPPHPSAQAEKTLA